jgi:hypothetical protein
MMDHDGSADLAVVVFGAQPNILNASAAQPG